MTLLTPNSPPVEDAAMATPPRGGAVRAMLAVFFGVALTLAMQGYQFGKSNHTVYLIDGLRHAHPELLANDWFATKTLQYHAAFGRMTRALMRVGAVEPAFLAGYVVLVVLLHLAWWRIVASLGGGAGAFVVSEVLYHASAGGTGLGMYQFLQDGAFLPSNIAAVALLWGIAFWLEQRRVAAGACFGLAGLFHLNYALVGAMLWVLLISCRLRHRSCATAPNERPALLAGSALALVPSVVNIALALGTTARRSGSMPLAEFVDLYVRLRHPHHYDPSSWPAWLWLSFLWPIPLAVIAWTRRRRAGAIDWAWTESAKMTAIFALVLVVALIGAGLTYTSETLVQASLYRFSIYPKLLTCIGAAMLLPTLRRPAAETQAVEDSKTGSDPVFATVFTVIAIFIGFTLVVASLVRGPYLGLFRFPDDDASYLAACDWVATNTPVDAVFIVPPSEQAFRLRARRAIVVNFKGVPQLSGELREWRDRLQTVLDLPDLRSLPRPFAATLSAIEGRYDTLPPEHFEAVAKRYGASYALAGRSWGAAWEPRRVNLPENDRWFLYDLRAR